MYNYHNDLRASHPASSPWWAWPFDFKPVWFFQQGYANDTTGITYDAGNLVIFWISVPVMAWTAWQAWARRSLALTVLVIGFACQWLSWSRIDRASFQYHYYTALPFLFAAVAYWLAELWHGPSWRTWLVARLAAAGVLVAAPLLWLVRVPLCSLAGTSRVAPNSQVLRLRQPPVRPHGAGRGVRRGAPGGRRDPAVAGPPGHGGARLRRPTASAPRGAASSVRGRRGW